MTVMVCPGKQMDEVPGSAPRLETGGRVLPATPQE
jgi:hypothetical protein